jgi:hypothetical protein
MNLVNKANFGAQFVLVCLFLFFTCFEQHVYSFSLHVSSDCVPIIRRNYCICATLGACYSVWMTVWYAYQTVIHTE